MAKSHNSPLKSSSKRSGSPHRSRHVLSASVNKSPLKNNNHNHNNHKNSHNNSSSKNKNNNNNNNDNVKLDGNNALNAAIAATKAHADIFHESQQSNKRFDVQIELSKILELELLAAKCLSLEFLPYSNPYFNYNDSNFDPLLEIDQLWTSFLNDEDTTIINDEPFPNLDDSNIAPARRIKMAYTWYFFHEIKTPSKLMNNSEYLKRFKYLYQLFMSFDDGLIPARLRNHSSYVEIFSKITIQTLIAVIVTGKYKDKDWNSISHSLNHLNSKYLPDSSRLNSIIKNNLDLLNDSLSDLNIRVKIEKGSFKIDIPPTKVIKLDSAKIASRVYKNHFVWSSFAKEVENYFRAVTSYLENVGPFPELDIRFNKIRAFTEAEYSRFVGLDPVRDGLIEKIMNQNFNNFHDLKPVISPNKNDKKINDNNNNSNNNNNALEAMLPPAPSNEHHNLIHPNVSQHFDPSFQPYFTNASSPNSANDTTTQSQVLSEIPTDLNQNKSLQDMQFLPGPSQEAIESMTNNIIYDGKFKRNYKIGYKTPKIEEIQKGLWRQDPNSGRWIRNRQRWNKEDEVKLTELFPFFQNDAFRWSRILAAGKGEGYFLNRRTTDLKDKAVNLGLISKKSKNNTFY